MIDWDIYLRNKLTGRIESGKLYFFDKEKKNKKIHIHTSLFRNVFFHGKKFAKEIDVFAALNVFNPVFDEEYNIKHLEIDENKMALFPTWWVKQNAKKEALQRSASKSSKSI